MYCRLSQYLLPAHTSQRVLELGCGPGRYVAMLASFGYKVTGVDPCTFSDWESIKDKYQVDFISGVKGENLPFPNCHFDHAVCLGTILYLDDPVAALKELRRVVKPGGRLVVRTVNKFNLFTRLTGRKMDPASKNLYTMEELCALLKVAGFESLEKFYFEFRPPFFPNFWWYLQSVWLTPKALTWLSERLRPESRAQLIILAVAK